mmetsp:Transcript_1362/g.1518  ORF Transcript_1362/g.1518 Transcript_1362/m.1518 type:complete len:230 (+) Transcript_1362:437-1126(+)
MLVEEEEALGLHELHHVFVERLQACQRQLVYAQSDAMQLFEQDVVCLRHFRTFYFAHIELESVCELFVQSLQQRLLQRRQMAAGDLEQPVVHVLQELGGFPIAVAEIVYEHLLDLLQGFSEDALVLGLHLCGCVFVQISAYFREGLLDLPFCLLSKLVREDRTQDFSVAALDLGQIGSEAIDEFSNLIFPVAEVRDQFFGEIPQFSSIEFCFVGHRYFEPCHFSRLDEL